MVKHDYHAMTKYDHGDSYTPENIDKQFFLEKENIENMMIILWSW